MAIARRNGVHFQKIKLTMISHLRLKGRQGVRASAHPNCWGMLASQAGHMTRRAPGPPHRLLTVKEQLKNSGATGRYPVASDCCPGVSAREPKLRKFPRSFETGSRGMTLGSSTANLRKFRNRSRAFPRGKPRTGRATIDRVNGPRGGAITPNSAGVIPNPYPLAL